MNLYDIYTNGSSYRMIVALGDYKGPGALCYVRISPLARILSKPVAATKKEFLAWGKPVDVESVQN